MDYRIAGIRIRLPGGLVTGSFAKALAPFAVAGEGAPAERDKSGTSRPAPDLVLEAGVPVAAAPGYREIYAFDFADADADCRLGYDAEGYLFEMLPRGGGKPVRLRKVPREALVRCDITPEHNPALLRFGLWMAFNLTAVPLGVVAVHASVVTCRGGGVLVLGESGTGKSTHTRLWRQHIPGAGLLNDDSPFVRFDDGRPEVCGSPWSGKTPCYKNLHLPLRGIVRLSQAPHNRIRRLSGLGGYAALQPSFPPAFAHDGALFDAINDLASALLKQVPAFHLECLPDEGAARLACETIFPDR